MCLAVPVQIVEINGRQAVCAVGGTRVRAYLDLIEDAQVGDWVLVHAGFAITKVDAAEAEETWKLVGEALGNVSVPEAAGDN
ncbi:MAG: HypC/HybG/HupF family hydrogenase formation chaperone [Armatimonadetes bacterium]|nr:HypC/HybG/HupF family hydrogenase formation chaperone [Armatimonadota bacterium]